MLGNVRCRLGRGAVLTAALAVTASAWIAPATSSLARGGPLIPRSSAFAGSLARVTGKGGCYSAAARTGCIRGREIDDAVDVVVSPDGDNVYVVEDTAQPASGSWPGAIVTFRRDPDTGALTQLAGGSGCITAASTHPCTYSSAIQNPQALVISPDGRNAYVVGQDGTLTAWRRNLGTGALTQLSGTAGCLAQAPAPAGCAQVRDLGLMDDTADLAISANGDSVYVGSGAGIAVFDRRQGGKLTQPSGSAGCLAAALDAGHACQTTGLPEVLALAISSDDRHLYYSGGLSFGVLDRASNGRLTTGTTCFIAAASLGDSVCAKGENNGFLSMAPEPSGGDLYVGDSAAQSVGLFEQSGTNLSQPSGVGGCVGVSRNGCAPGYELGGDPLNHALGVTADGRNVYEASGGFDSAEVLAVLQRDSATGALSQPASRSSCIAQGISGCTGSGGLEDPAVLAVAPDGRTVYAFWLGGQALVAYRRSS